MIDEIQVENLALIREATLVPARGLTVLTGETGAGKTALLSALKLLMGARADKDAVRDGEEALSVSGRFYGAVFSGFASSDDLAGRSSADAVESGEADDGVPVELVAMRRVTSDGRSRVSIDGRMASVGELARAIAPTIDLCGQHEHQQLMKTSQHVRMLDAWAGDAVVQARTAYEEAFATANAAAAELTRVREAGEASSAKLDEARFVLQRIDAVDPREGEYDELLDDLARVEHAEALAVAANGAHEALAGEQGAIDALGSAVAALDGAARYDAKLGEFADALREAGYVLEDMARETRDYREGVEFDPETLAQQQERMASLQGLLRTYGPRMEDVLARRAEAADLVSLVDDAAERERAAQRELDLAEEALAQAASALADARAEAAPRFAEAVTAQMDRLEMGGAQLVCDLAPLERVQWTKAGPQAVEFLFRPGAHRIGRRGQPRHAGREGGAGRGRRRGHACVRRGGCGRGRFDRRGAGRRAGRFGAHAPGDRRHAPRAGGRPRPGALRGAQGCGGRGGHARNRPAAAARKRASRRNRAHAVGRCYRDIACARARDAGPSGRIAQAGDSFFLRSAPFAVSGDPRCVVCRWRLCRRFPLRCTKRCDV